jgi:hypothetical protein
MCIPGLMRPDLDGAFAFDSRAVTTEQSADVLLEIDF